MRIFIWLTMAAVCPGVAAAQEKWFFEPDAGQSEAAAAKAETAAAKAEKAAERSERGRERSDSAYRNGTRAIDKREYEAAIESFDSVVERKGDRADGALYWKAYAQNRLGRRDQALATVAQLEKEYPQSRWLNDAKALEVEVRQASGQPVSPDAESNEELKLLAMNGLMNSDPERAIPLLEKVLSDPKASPRVKERALFVVSQSNDPRGRNVLARIAKGGSANPDMQLKAVEFLGLFSKGNTQPLADIYNGNNDPAVRRAVIRALMLSGDADRLFTLAKSEKSPDLRKEAIRTLGLIHRERTGEMLGSLYTSESDRSVKMAVIDGLFVQSNAKTLVDLARKENDLELKKQIVQRLALMHSKEATDYMMEVLNK